MYSSSFLPLNSFLVTGQNEFCFSSKDKAELLNKYFTSSSTVNDENVALPAFEYKCQNRLSSITCTAHEVASLMELLNPNTATGRDGISNKMLKAVAKEVAVPLGILFDRAFKEASLQMSINIQTLYNYPKSDITLVLQFFDPFYF